MSAILRRAYGKGDKTREYLGAQRSGANLERGHVVTTGHLFCIHCGAGGLSMGDFAAIAGVTPRDVSNFLNHRPIREDKAARIREHLAEVREP